MRRCRPFWRRNGKHIARWKTSGLPRYLEGARYAAQWSGFPYSVYSPSEGKNDYTDDINARSRIIKLSQRKFCVQSKGEGIGRSF